jgi:hypothetical protein
MPPTKVKTKKIEKEDTKNKPWVGNYPPLDAWLKKHNGRCMWQLRNGGTEDDPQSYLECWLVNTRPVLIQVHANQHGWSIFTELDSSKIDETLTDAEKRLGIKEPT